VWYLVQYWTTPAGAGNFYLHHRVQNGSGAHPAYPMGARGFSQGVKRPVSEADHSPPSSAEVKEWVQLYLHSPQYAFMASCSVQLLPVGLQSGEPTEPTREMWTVKSTLANNRTRRPVHSCVFSDATGSVDSVTRLFSYALDIAVQISLRYEVVPVFN
jgi:hypothetical protein